MNIPKQLQDKSFRFIKIDPESKRPIELDWTMSANYKYNEPEFIDYLKTAKCYGIACGFGKLAVVDLDIKEATNHIKPIINALPKTFTIKTGSGGYHLYFIVTDFTKKIVIEQNDIHYGEVQWTGAQALGPGSLHAETGNTYDIVEDTNIAEITAEQLMKILQPFMVEEKICSSGASLDIWPIAKQIKGLIKKGNKLTGSHPIHGSDSGINFEIDLEKNVWHCFRCGTGGDALTLIALLEGKLACDECCKGALEGKKFIEIVQIAKNKYGYEKISKDSVDTKYKLSSEEKKILEKPDLIYNIITETRKEGLIGEEMAQLVLIIKIALRLVKNANNTSSNILVSDQSGAGKDYLTGKLCKVMLEAEKTMFHQTMISEKVLNYWEPEGQGSSWDGRVMYLEDPDEDVLKTQAFKVRASGQNAQTNLDTNHKVLRQTILGKPVMIVTSMNANIDIELERRWDILQIDTGVALSKAVLDHQFKVAAGLIEYRPDYTLRNALKHEPRVNVIVPYAMKIANYVLKQIHGDGRQHLLMRSQNLKLIDFIKASAALHQFQRKTDEQGNIIATLEDYYIGALVFDYLDCSSGEVTNTIERQLLAYLDSKNESVPLSDIIKNVGPISRSWLYRNKDRLIERGLLIAKDEYSPEAGRNCEHLLLAEKSSSLRLPPVSKLGNTKGYISTQLLNDINNLRKKDKLGEL